ncbi:MAG TPA: NAD-dependent epimerase/dehydratase family protein [Microvirga sp.]|jgi:2'-hydroxyisoflavone reductase
MDVLVVGGTGFLGGAIVEAAQAAGHAVSVLARGETRRPLPEGVQRLVGDRHRDLSALAGRSFDLVVDTCAYGPDAVEGLLDALQDRIGRYALISSVSVYGDYSKPGLDENAPTPSANAEQLAFARELPPERRSSAASYATAYGPLKRACEEVATRRLGDRAFLVRAGLLVGAGDYTDRLTYWVRRIDQGGTVPCPGDPARLVQLIDARDIAAWTIEGATCGLSGAFNITGQPFSFGALLDACRAVSDRGAHARFVWTPDEAVLAAGLAPWTEVPVWLPASNTAFRHFMNISVEKAFAHGLSTRPLADTLAQILAWDRARRDKPLTAGMPPEKEAALLQSLAA